MDEDFERAYADELLDDEKENNVRGFNVEGDEDESDKVSDSGSSTLKFFGITAAVPYWSRCCCWSTDVNRAHDQNGKRAIVVF